MNITDEMLFACAAEARDIWLSILDEDDGQEDYVPSARFQRKMKKLIRKSRRSPRTNAAIRYAKRAAVILLAVSVITFSGLMTVEAFRTEVVQVVTEVFETLTSYIYHSEQVEPEPIADIEFGWLPDGMTEAERDEELFYRRVRFENSEGGYIRYTQKRVNKKVAVNRIEDSESATVKMIPINGQEAQLMEKDDVYILVWTIEQNVITLHSNLSPEILVSVAEQIILKN